MDAGLVRAGKAGIETLLKLKGTQITLRARGATRRPSGGYNYTGGEEREPQAFAFRRAGSARTPTGAETNRKIVDEPYIMTGRFDAAVDEGDTGTVGDIVYTVDRVDKTSGWKTECEVTARIAEKKYDGV